MLVDVSTHASPHIVRPPLHVVVVLHAPASHTWPVPHALPHVPQLLGSELGSMQLPPQSRRGSAHAPMHTPSTQEPSQIEPQLPQCSESERRSTQPPPHEDKPSVHMAPGPPSRSGSVPASGELVVLPASSPPSTGGSGRRPRPPLMHPEAVTPTAASTKITAKLRFDTASLP